MTGARPLRVSAIGARLSDEISPQMYNYGQLQVVFDDGSVGWYEAGWGPMVSETAFFVKDVVGPKGCVSITATRAGGESQSDNIEAHTKTDALRVHYSQVDDQGRFARPDAILDMQDEPSHDELTEREQRYLLRAIHENIDLKDHWSDALNSLRIVLAADESVRSGKIISVA
jgi:predicted dehydrogenase